MRNQAHLAVAHLLLGTVVLAGFTAHAAAQSTTLAYIPGTSVRLEQIEGDCDLQAQAKQIVAGETSTCVSTTSQTITRFNIAGSDNGRPFEANGKLFFTFGDTISSNTSLVRYNAGDPIAWSTSTNPEQGLLLNFFTKPNGSPLFVQPPGVAMGIDDIPEAGVGLNGAIYLIVNTGSDITLPVPQSPDFSVLVQFDEAAQTFTPLRTVSPVGGHFVFPSIHLFGSNVLIYGVGPYHASDVFLQMVPAASFVSGAGTQYFAGLDKNGQPTWAATESGAVPVVQDNPLKGPVWPNDSPTTGKVSVIYSGTLGLWLMTYDGGRQSLATTGTYFSHAPQPWGPWSTPQLIFNKKRDNATGLGGFIHDANILPDPPGDGLNGPVIGTTNNIYTTAGTDYAPYMIERFTTVSGSTLKIYWTLSTFNPYVVVKMRSEFAITGCQYSLNQGGQVFTAAGGSGTVTITTGPGCAWSVANLPPGVTITGASSGTGSGTVNFQVAAGSSGVSSAFMIGGQTFTIEQQAPSIAGLNLIGSMPHIAAAENWTTAFTLVNKGTTPATARLSLFGDPSGTLDLPLAFPQQPPSAGPLLASSLDRSIAANASLIVDSAGAQLPPVQIGSAQLSATGSVDGFAIFHLIPGAQEAVVPMETRNASSYLLAFDNTNGVVLGVAVANVSVQAGTVAIILRDDTGERIGSGSLALAANGHASFVLSAQYPMSANKRGTIQFNTPAGGQIGVLGIRTTPMGSTNTLTTIPALANVGTNGGSISHLATGNGWQTTFVLVNTGGTSAQVNLKFFADLTGEPLSLPLTFPPASVTTTASSFSQTLAAGATLLVQSAAPLSNPSPTTGSAQLTTNGNVGGFVIFRYNPNGQEAVVPLENRNANAYAIAFDNTNGTATGIAINSVSAQAVNVPVIVRDDTGGQIATDSLALAPNGHLAFTLVADKYPFTANSRGTIEFGTPPGAQIGALGIRIPAGHTFTTLPAFAK